jgi:hypothetical protein
MKDARPFEKWDGREWVRDEEAIAKAKHESLSEYVQQAARPENLA